jgi:hypothetical protein
MDHCIKTGAYIHLVDYGSYAPADLYAVAGGTVVARFNGDLEKTVSFDPQRPITHLLRLNTSINYWNKRLGVAVVPAYCLVLVTPQDPTTTKENA